MSSSDPDFDTLAVQAGLRGNIGDAISTIIPVVASTTFTHESIEQVHDALTGEASGFAYARNANPTVQSLEVAVTRLEGAEECVAFGSGMAALHASVLGLGVGAGDAVLAAADLYGVTRSMLLQLAEYEISVEFVDVRNIDGLEARMDALKPRALIFESVSNPLLKVSDVGAIAAAARSRRVTTILDNTFAGPYLLRPLQLGIDVVLHSATKYLAGHGDAVAGVVATDSSRARRIRGLRTLTGGIASPFEAWLTMRGIRTLHVRMARHCSSALEIARWLDAQPWVERVYYPGLDSHADHALARAQFSDRYGGMIAFELRGERNDVLRFVDRLSLIAPGTSLGDVESLVLYPALSSHRTLTDEEKEKAGITDRLLRLSVGLESVNDLESDLCRASSALEAVAR